MDLLGRMVGSPSLLMADPSGAAPRQNDETVTFTSLLERYLDDMHAFGRLTTSRSIAEYRSTIRRHADDAEGASPAQTHARGREGDGPSLEPPQHATPKALD